MYFAVSGQHGHTRDCQSSGAWVDTVERQVGGTQPYPDLEKCVDKGAGAGGSKSHKQADQAKNQQDGDEPPLFVFSDKKSEFLNQ